MNNPQQSQLDLAQQARDARDAGIARTVDHANDVVPNWSEIAFKALEEYAKRRERFTSEDFRDAYTGPQPPDLHAFGGIFQRASRRGFIVGDGWTVARDPKHHCNPKRIWRSALYEGIRAVPAANDG